MSPQYNSQNKLARSKEVIDYPVLIVGGSLVGLSTALFLSSHGIPSILIERHQRTSNHPRAAGYNLRTMELFRSVGLEQIIHDAGLNMTGSGGILVVESLTGKEIGWFEPPYHKYSNKDILQISPVKRWGVCAQDVLEPILRKRIEEIGIADLRFNNELLSFEEHKEECVNALVKERSSDHKYRVRAQYMIAADGSKSFVRDKLAIKTHGPGTLIHLIGIYFHSDLSKYTRGRKFAICHVNNELVNGTIVGYGNNRYVLNVVYYPEKGQTIWDFTEQRCIKYVQSAVGISNLEVEIKSILPWELGAYSADRFQKGRVFLVGDAAHVMPPTGAFGANTGIQDAHNLAWKLAMVIKEEAGTGLLSTYDTERHPVVQSTINQVLLRSADRGKLISERNQQIRVDQQSEIIDDLDIMLGYRYYSQAIKSEDFAGSAGSADSVGQFESPLSPTGKPGTRAPHLILRQRSNGSKLSILDLYGKNFVLLTGKDGNIWVEAANSIANYLRTEIDTYRIGGDGDNDDCELVDITGHFHKRFALSFDGAVLIRPDGFIAWRSRSLNNYKQNSATKKLSNIVSSLLLVKRITEDLELSEK
jgi:2-polyprenyl-6-methoxyphenol hydroxylase-like FAD-dependent oxidoreductase